MGVFLEFASRCGILTALLFLLNAVLACLIASRAYAALNAHLTDAALGKAKARILRAGYFDAVRRYVDRKIEKGGVLSEAFRKASDTVLKCGFPGRGPAFLLLSCRFVLPAVFAAAAFAANFPDFAPSILCAALAAGLVQYCVFYLKRKHAAEFKNSAYKIYRYLHNQISAGVNVTDAVKTVYKAAEGGKLKENLLLLSARYARTLDMEAALEEFKNAYGVQEVESLCVALAQAVRTGENKDILERQEKLMFKQYFNRVQAETDLCRLKSSLVVVMFVAIIIMLVGVPMMNDVKDAVNSIFIN